MIRSDLKALGLLHPADHFLVFISFLAARTGTLEQAIIALGVKQSLFVKSGLLKTVIDIGRQHKIVLIFHQPQQVFIDRLRCILIAVDPDIAAPVCPVFLSVPPVF